MQKRNCIQERLVTVPFIRGHGSISNPKSNNSSIYCHKDGVDHYSPLDNRTNDKNFGLNICNDRTQDQFEKSVCIFECI